MRKRDRAACVGVLSAAMGFAAALAAQQPARQALAALGSCTGSFKPSAQAAPEDGNSGALKLGFENLDKGVVMITWTMGVATFNNPRDPGVAFPRLLTMKNAVLAGNALTTTPAGGARFDLTVATVGGKPVVAGSYIRGGNDTTLYMLGNCGG